MLEFVTSCVWRNSGQWKVTKPKSPFMVVICILPSFKSPSFNPGYWGETINPENWVLILIAHLSRRKKGGIFPCLLKDLPMFDGEPPSSNDLSEAGPCWAWPWVPKSVQVSLTHSLSLSILATPRCWITFLLLTVIREFLLNKEHLIILYSELLWDCSIHAPLPLVHFSSHIYDQVCENIFPCLWSYL